MANEFYKPRAILTSTGPTTQLQPVVLSFSLTPEQQAQIARITGAFPTRFGLSASDLKLVLTPDRLLNPGY